MDMTTAIYERVSTEEQAQEGFSIRAQEEKLKDYARIKGWPVYGVYCDEGISGKNITERPAINRMIDDIKAGKIKNVLVFKLDRLTRSVADLVFLIDLFKQNDCDFNSLMESLDTSTASGRMFIKIIGIFAEFERENIAERVRVGHERKAREGYSNSAQINSYGYDRANGQRIQTINEAEAAIVREIYDMFVKQGLSYTGIAKRMNVRNVPTKKGGTWSSKTIKCILTNCNYVGKIRYGTEDPERYFEADGLHEPIISNEQYVAAQDIIARIPAVNRTKRPLDINFFAGLLFCEKCGSKLNTQQSAKQKEGDTKVYSHGYICYSRHVSACDAPAMRHYAVEDAFKEYLLGGLHDLTVGDKLKLEAQERAKRETAAQLESYREKMRFLDAKEKEVQGFYLSGEIPFDGYRSMKSQLDGDRAAILEELAKLEALEAQDNTLVCRGDIMLNFQENWEYMTNVQKRQFLTRFIKKIVVFNERTPGVFYGKVRIREVQFNAA